VARRILLRSASSKRCPPGCVEMLSSLLFAFSYPDLLSHPLSARITPLTYPSGLVQARLLQFESGQSCYMSDSIYLAASSPAPLRGSFFHLPFSPSEQCHGSLACHQRADSFAGFRVPPIAKTTV
jgi:hypothetical protein